ncbi:serine/threonine-protein kinase [Myxococcota bacterium]
MVAQTAQAGRVLADRYRLESRLGEGGFGSIWHAHHLVLEAPVAIKLIDPEIAEDQAAIERFMREAKAAASLRSPHVVQILDYGVDQHQPFIVMELLEGENLAERLRRVGRLSPPTTARIVNQVARAVGRAHESGIVHRDLKPENVFLVRNDDEELAKVVDFGLAKVEKARLGQPGTKTRTGSLLGTPYYMSPEQAQGNKEVDYRSDLWSLGVIAFESITGQRPFVSDGLGELVIQICVRSLPVPSEHAPVPPAFDSWFAHACAREPEDRFRSARELAETLRDALGIDEEEAMITVPEEDRQSWSKARPSPNGAVRNPRTGDHHISQAKTVQAEPGLLERAAAVSEDDRWLARLSEEGEAPLSVQQFGATVRDEEENRGSGRGMVLAVAGLALAVGLVTGVLALRSRASQEPVLEAQSSPSSVATQGASAPGTAAKDAHIRSKLAQVLAPLPSTDSSAGVVPSASPSAPTSVAPFIAKPHGNKSIPEGVRSPRTRPQNEDSAPPESWLPARVDGGWVKPEWAQPDPESPYDHLPTQESDNPY